MDDKKLHENTEEASEYIIIEILIINESLKWIYIACR
jgi:hypothetical protein